MQVNVENSVILITGGNRKNGIGQALVHEAIENGAKKVYVTAREPKQLDDLVKAYQGKVFPLKLDVTDLNQIQEVVRLANDTQILINNAGFCGFSGVMKYKNQEARREFDVNFWGPLQLMASFSNLLIQNQPAALVNIISIGAVMSFPKAATYCASKAALQALTQAARFEMNEHNIPVFAVYPGPIDTDMAENLDFNKASPSYAAKKIIEGMKQGTLDITTDSVSDLFREHLQPDIQLYKAVSQEISKAS